MNIIDLKSNDQKTIIDQAIATLKQGGLIIYPTETCYGVGVDATNESAVSKLLSYKTFRDDKPISIAVAHIELAKKYVSLNKTALHLYKEYLPGPFTIISQGLGKVVKGVESNSGTLGVRIPNHEFMLKLLRKFGKPITATSANVSYKKTPYCIQDILNHTTKKQQDLIGLVIDAGILPKNDPSTVIDTTLDDVNILRQGDIILRENHKVVTKSEDETRKFGQRLIKNISATKKNNKPVLIAIQGELGAGKTYMTKGIAKAIGIEEEIISPTFIICREYNCSKFFKKLFHIDAYRLLRPEDLIEIGFEDMLKSKNLIIIEWAEKVSHLIKEQKSLTEIIWINMFHKSENERIIEYGNYS